MAFATLLKHNLKVSLRQRHDILLVVTFTLLAAFLFPLAIGSAPQILSKVAAGLIWVILVFAIQLSSPMVWRQDVEDGTLTQLLLSSIPIESIVLSKALSLWLVCLGSLSAVIPLISYAFHFKGDLLFLFLLTYLIISFPLSLLGVTGATLSLGHPRSSILSIVLMIPLYIPMIIFSSSALSFEGGGLIENSALLILIALSLGLSPLLVFINALALRWMTDL